MRTRSGQHNNKILFIVIEPFLIYSLLIYSLLGISNNVYAFDSWQGKVAANVNLRQSPRLDGKIITGIEKGDIVLVKDQTGDWYQVLFEQESFGYRGWMYGKYLEKLTEPSVNPASCTKDKINTAAGLIKKSQAEQQTSIDSPKKHLAEANTNRVAANPGKISGENMPGIIRPSKEKIIDNQQDKTPPKKLTTTAINYNFNGKPQKNRFAQINIPENPQAEKNRADLSGCFTNQNQHQNKTKPLTLLLRLVSVILSCFAIGFSYKALQFAKANSNSVRVQE